MKRFNCDFGSRFRILKGGKISLVVSAILSSTTLVFASPTGGTVTSGTANISQSGNTTNITQSTNKATINWQDFSIKSNETVNFKQPNVNSITLNRVVGNERSIIDGALNANGQVWILNSNGILFNNTAKINTAGILATTKNISDADFNVDNYKFTGNSTAGVINMGTIDASDSGYVALLANTVQNNGTIKAYKGTVHLTGASEATINLNGNSIVSLTINKGVLDALVENKGAVLADGGKIFLTTNAVDEILKGVVNNTGLIEANSLDDISGEIILFAHGGTVKVGGTITAKDGFVETSGRYFDFLGANIQSGKWLIDPVNITIDAALAGAIETALVSGDVTISTDGANTPSTSSGESGSDGDITVDAAISWNTAQKLTLNAFRNIYINQNITINNVNGELALYYGQGAVYAANSADYILSGTIQTINSNDFTVATAGNIIYTNGGKLTEKKGSNGVAITSNFKDAAYVTKEVVSNISNTSIRSDGVQGPFTWTIRPTDTHMIAVKPTGNDYHIDDISTLFSMTQESKDYINGVFNNHTTNYAVAYQDVTLTAGQMITTAWSYTSTDYAPYNDGSFLSFVNTSNSNDHTSAIYGLNSEAMVLGATVEGTGNWSTKSYGSTGWQTASFKAGEAGNYRIGYAVFNLDDTSLSPFLVLDTVAGTVLKNGVSFQPLAVDSNGPLAQSGIVINNSPVPEPTPTPAPEPTPTPVNPTTQDTNIEKVITTVVNNTINNVNLPKDILLPKVNLVQNMPILPMTPTVQSSPLMQNIAQKLGVNQGEQLSLVSTTLEGQSTERITLDELKNLSEGSNDSNAQTNTPLETRVAVGDNSIIELVNGGMALPEGVDQEFYVVKNKKNKK